MNPADQNYTIGSRELLSAGAHALKRFWGFIGGSFNLVRTDHESLKCFKTRRHVNQRRAPFVDNIDFFNAFIILIQFVPEQLAADALS
ncbi:hypothetical protein MJO28_013042 [Puccinia striiformis f. sp. tritici]|uniref:Uncharacterized protein n=1 Tax=Puccinia striiformis f. sp. tritici TaxID=168172 RepID=A0ACC0DX73_9BASI|nr:hypothetical protein MJO28_013042 [Puccinia striiformis f. sp. tritici]